MFVFSALLLAFMGVVPSILASPGYGKDMIYGFDSIQLSPNLQWVPCYDDFTCTKLEVPIDYTNISLGTTGIAFIKLAGSNATDDAESILINPGGPGGSGIDTLLTYGRANAEMIFGAQYNYVSFDPRGVSRSGLSFSCFGNNTGARISFARIHRSGIANASDSSIERIYHSSPIYGSWCDSAIQSTNPYGYYVTTPAVVRDMLTYIEAEAESLGKPKSSAKLWFYGLSYGTVIGTTFASLFPDRVGRMILDGVVDVEEYYTNNWKAQIAQGDKMVDSFATLCHQAGPENCSFWGPSTQNITSRLDSIMSRLEHEPVPISGLATGKLPTLGTFADLEGLILSAGYEPLASFPQLADALSELERGNASALGGVVDNFSTFPDASSIIKCADASGRNKVATIDDFREYAEYTAATSKYIGSVYPVALDIIICAGFRPSLVPDSMIWQGPLPPTSNGTSFPILFTSNTLDPITPIVSARRMSEYFKGSVLLIQEAVGHTVAQQRGSACYFNHVHAYLAGTVPPANITCPIEFVPFRDTGVPTMPNALKW
ncbi:Alpha/Beta hydrolase protein [Hypomontagnella submonticulosa]|nr:Alpha/Beta hydrolase protein [Hypomontagnella submonticulosa]